MTFLPMNNDSDDDPMSKTWIILAVAIAPLAVAAITDRIGSEISDYFRRKRIARKKAEKAARQAVEEEPKAEEEKKEDGNT